MTERFETLYELGRGANGVVHAVFDKVANLKLARKTLHPTDQEKTRLKAEFRLLADTLHPNLVKLFEMDLADDHLAFTMELVDGVTLDQHLANHIEDCRALLVQCLAGCEALHNQGLVHRDLKPTNILVENGRAVILDFGLTNTLQHASSSQGFYGTPRYASPEQLFSRPVTGRSDIFSLGMVFYEALIGELPDWYLSQKVARPSHPADEQLVMVLMKMLAIDAADRPDAGALMEMLGESHADLGEPRFVGRDALLEQLRGSGAATAGIQIVEGESGIGKSRLVRELAAHYESTGAMVISSECRVWENIGFQGLDGWMDAIASRLDDVWVDAMTTLELAAICRAFPLLPVPNTDVSGTEDKALRDALISCIYKTLKLQVEHQQLVLIIDDAQWLDSDSREILIALAQLGIFDEARLFIVARTGEETNGLKDRLPTAEVIEVPPFDQAEISDFLRINFDIDRSGIPDIFGSPFLLSEVGRYAALDTDVDLSEQTILARKVSTLEDRYRDLLDVIYACDRPADQALLNAACKTTGSLYIDLLNLQKLSWIRTLTVDQGLAYLPYHSRIREFVQRQRHGKQASVHADIATALKQVHPKRYESLYYHLDQSDQRGEAAIYAMQAGKVSQTRLAFDRAKDQLRYASDWGEFDGETLSELMLREAQVLYNLGECSLAAERVDAAPPGHYLDHNERILLSVNAHLSAGKMKVGLTRMRDIVSEQELSNPGRRTLWLKLLFQVVYLRLFALNYVAQDEPEIVDLARVYESLGKLNMVSTKHGSLFQLQSLIEYLKLGDEKRIAPGLAFLGNIFAHLGTQPEFARRCMARALEIGTKYNDGYILGSCQVWQANMAVLKEEWQLAISLAEEGITLMEEQHYGMTWECSTAKNFQLMALEKLGQLDRVLELAQSHVDMASIRNDSYTRTMFSLFDYFWNIPYRTTAETFRLVATIRQDWQADVYTIQHFFMLRIEVFALLYDDRPEEALVCIDKEWRKVVDSDVLDVPNTRLDAAILMATCLLNLVVRYPEGPYQRRFRKALRLFDGSILQESRAYKLLFEGRFATITGKTGQGIPLIRDAQDEFSRLGSPIPYAYAHHLLTGEFYPLARLPEKWISMMTAHYLPSV